MSSHEESSSTQQFPQVYKSKAESSKKEYIGALTAYRTSLESKSIPTVLTGGEDQKKSPSTMVSTAVHHKTDHNQINTLFKKPLSKHTNREQVSQQAQVQKVIPVEIPPSPLVVADSVQQQQQKPLTENEQMNLTNVCIRQGCSNLAVSNPEWENEYCSTDCVLSHCREVYNNWVKLRRDKTNNFSSRQ